MEVSVRELDEARLTAFEAGEKSGAVKERERIIKKIMDTFGSFRFFYQGQSVDIEAPRDSADLAEEKLRFVINGDK